MKNDVLKIAADTTVELNLTATSNSIIWSEAYTKALSKNLSEKGIDMTRIHEYIFAKDIKAKIANS